MIPNEELHDELLKTLRHYFESNQIWATKPTRNAAIAVRHHLSELIRICTKQRTVVQNWRYEVYPARTSSKHVKKRYQDQNRSDDATDKDN